MCWEIYQVLGALLLVPLWEGRLPLELLVLPAGEADLDCSDLNAQ